MMSMEKPTYRQRLLTMKSRLDGVLMLAIALKEDLEAKVDELDHRYGCSKKKMSARTYDRYEKFTSAIDELDKIVGHLAEADTVSVRL